MIAVGDYNVLVIDRKTKNGVYLDDGDGGILLPNQYVPAQAKEGDRIKVFVYHDNEARLIATTLEPIAVVGDIVQLRAVEVTEQGAFLDIGIMKDIFIHTSNMLQVMQPNNLYWVKIYIDTINGRITASQRIEDFIDNKELTIKEKQAVELIAYRKTDIGFMMIINKKHLGVMHYNEIFRPIFIGDVLEGFVKKIHPREPDSKSNYKIDVSAGKLGYNRVEDETEKIIRLLQESRGYLPFHDKSAPEDIYNYFAMSKKTFKMAVGKLYKSGQILLESKGIRLKEK